MIAAEYFMYKLLEGFELFFRHRSTGRLDVLFNKHNINNKNNSNNNKYKLSHGNTLVNGGTRKTLLSLVYVRILGGLPNVMIPFRRD